MRIEKGREAYEMERYHPKLRGWYSKPRYRVNHIFDGELIGQALMMTEVKARKYMARLIEKQGFREVV